MRSTTVRFVLVAMLCILVVGADTPPDADVTRFELVRTTTGPASYRLVVNHRSGDGSTGLSGLAAAVAFRTDTSGTVTSTRSGFVVTDDSDRRAGVWVDGEERLCGHAEPCPTGRIVLGAQTVIADSDDGGEDVPNRVFVVFEGYDLDLSFGGDGWELHEADFDHRYVEWQQDSPLGVSGGMDGVEVFTGTSLDGGALGSIAVAMPPCSPSHASVTLGVAKGVGTLTLLGGPNEPSLTCPGTGFLSLTDHAPAATTWTADGVVVGEYTFEDVRLFVFDLPVCHALLPGVAGRAPDTDLDCAA